MERKLELGSKTFQAYAIPFQNCEILLIAGEKGALACGYFNPETAEKMGHALAVVTGVKNFDDMLKAGVRFRTSAAAKLGIEAGMTGAEALERLG